MVAWSRAEYHRTHQAPAKTTLPANLGDNPRAAAAQLAMMDLDAAEDILFALPPHGMWGPVTRKVALSGI